MSIRLASAEIEFIVHATESKEKLLGSVNNNLIDTEFIVNRLLGYFGNEILLLRSRLAAKDAEGLMHRILRSLSRMDRMHLYRSFVLYTDGDSLYIRLSKQDIIRGVIHLSQNDPIKIRFRFARNMHKLMLEELRSMLRDEG